MEKKMERCKKVDTITIRCSEELKKYLKEEAKKRDKTVSAYLLDSGIAGLESGQGRKKKIVKVLAELTEPVNACYDYLQSENLEREEMKEHYLSSNIKEIEQMAGTKVKAHGTHVIRHTCASLYFRRGVKVELIASLLGHSIDVCRSTNSHFVEEQKKATVKLIEDFDIG